MPDLGKYANAVLSSYALSILLVLWLVALSVLRSRKIRRQLRDLEKRQVNNG